MKVIAITGRSGSGKSTVSAYYGSLGYPVLDADRTAREVTRPGGPCLAQLCDAFGSDILLPDGTLDRGCLAARAFATPEGTRRLTDITHPAIIRELLDGVAAAQSTGVRVCGRCGHRGRGIRAILRCDHRRYRARAGSCFPYRAAGRHFQAGGAYAPCGTDAGGRTACCGRLYHSEYGRRAASARGGAGGAGTSARKGDEWNKRKNITGISISCWLSCCAWRVFFS